MLSPLQTFSTMMDDRTLRAYLRNNSAWNLDESAPGPPIDHFNISSTGNSDRLLNSSVHFPVEMRSANLNDMVSNIIDENSEYHQNAMLSTYSQYPSTSIMMPTTWSNGEQSDQHIQYMQQVKNIPPRQTKFASSTISESGHPRNIPDTCSIRPNPPKDIQVLIRKGDHTGINSLITNMPLQQFRQMIGLQCSSNLTTINDRRISSSLRTLDNRRPYTSLNNNLNQTQHQPLSSSSSSSSSSIGTLNSRLVNNFKQRSQDTILQQNYSSFQNNDRQHSPMLPISPRDTLSINFSGANSGTSTINDANLTSPVTTCQDIRRTGVANTLHIAIEKCYEQLNYIRDSYTETESKVGIQTLHRSSSSSLINDITNSNLSTLSNNPSRVDRLIAEYHYEYTRIIRLHERVKEILHMQDIEATRQTLDEWLNAINNVQERRRQEIDNAAEKCRSGEPRLPDEKDVLQLAEALRILRITTRKIRTVLWYWLYWITNSTTNKIPLIARHQDEQLNIEFQSTIHNDQHSTYNLFYPSTNNEDESKTTLESDEQRKILFKNSLSSNDNNKENECNK
ncbi:unnamed protein product [Rotaria sp. Silwood1]|nr:unnamed protein product [Rotaria sp. Silwood1]CAF1230067.1 unnamed protein product [Rotaria sp. Silwood1]CAF1232685.1 unnamed protein product [Rotaria sp. Silwood1]CAF3486382.1 unnamed protein product [Rotaria sp. Silwood1]CAF3488166.1 unnamed protein product [Rotaria sp. Silwood1]